MCSTLKFIEEFSNVLGEDYSFGADCWWLGSERNSKSIRNVIHLISAFSKQLVHPFPGIFVPTCRLFSPRWVFPVNHKLHMGIKNCHRQRLKKPFVSFTHSLWPFWVFRKHLSTVAKWYTPLSDQKSPTTSAQLLLLLRRSAATLKCPFKTILCGTRWLFDTLYCHLQHSIEL